MADIDVPVIVDEVTKQFFVLRPMAVIDAQFLHDDGNFRPLQNKTGEIMESFDGPGDATIRVTLWSPKSADRPKIHSQLQLLKRLENYTMGFNLESDSSAIVVRLETPSTDLESEDGFTLLGEKRFRLPREGQTYLDFTVPKRVLRKPTVRVQGGLTIVPILKYRARFEKLNYAITAKEFNSRVLSSLSEVGSVASTVTDYLIPIGGDAVGRQSLSRALASNTTLRIIRGQGAKGAHPELIEKMVDKVMAKIETRFSIRNLAEDKMLSFFLANSVSVSMTVGQLKSLSFKQLDRLTLSSEEFDRVLTEGSLSKDIGGGIVVPIKGVPFGVNGRSQEAEYSKQESERLRKQYSDSISMLKKHVEGNFPLISGIDLKSVQGAQIEEAVDELIIDVGDAIEGIKEISYPLTVLSQSVERDRNQHQKVALAQIQKVEEVFLSCQNWVSAEKARDESLIVRHSPPWPDVNVNRLPAAQLWKSVQSETFTMLGRTSFESKRGAMFRALDYAVWGGGARKLKPTFTYRSMFLDMEYPVIRYGTSIYLADRDGFEQNRNVEFTVDVGLAWDGRFESYDMHWVRT